MREAEVEQNSGTRRANTALVMMWVSIGALIINASGATLFWFALPEKLRNMSADVAKLATQMTVYEARLTTYEARSASQESVMARVDERTKAMQDDLRQIHQDFSFRATARPQ